MSGISRVNLQSYPQTNLSSQLLKHQMEMLNFMFFTDYDIIYETFQLKHAAYLQKRQGQVASKFKTEQIQRHFQIASQRLHVRVLRDDIDLDKQLSKLQLLWHNRNIPYFHRYYVEKYLFTAYFKTLLHSITVEQKLVKQEQHIYFSIFRAINARQACLRQLKRALAQLTPEDVYQYLHVAKERLYEDRRKNQKEKYQIQGFKVNQITDQKNTKLTKTKLQFFSDNFTHLTKLTLYVIELILKWRQYVRSLTHDQKKQKQRMQYYFYDDNYFLKILNDIGFLRVSFLSNFYEFAPKNDPFLLRCILAFQKKQEKTLEHELLKQIFYPAPQLLPEILAKVQFLSQQYKSNIRSRKVYDLKLIKGSNDLAKQKHVWNQQHRQPISNVVLKKLQPKKASSLKAFRVRQHQKKDRIVVQFKGPKDQNKKIRATSIPGVRQKMVIQSEDSPMRNSVIIQKHPLSKQDLSEMMDSRLLASLKQQVIKKIKIDFKEEQRSHLSRNQALQMYIESKVKQAMKGVFPYQPQKQFKLPMEFTTLTIPDDELPSELTKIYKKSIVRFHEMQLNQMDLSKRIESKQFVYFVKATVGEQQIGRIICTLDRQIIQYKVIRVMHIGFYDVSQLEMLMLRFVQFLWKYQNSYEVVYTFFLPTHHQVIKELIQTLQKNLSNNCLVATKQIYSNVAEVRFIFKRKQKNVNYIPNKHPISLHFKMDMIISQQKLMLQNPQHNKISDVSYDYFLMEVIRKYVSSDDFIIMKEKVPWKQRLKQILDDIIAIEKDQSSRVEINMIQAENITELNKILARKNKKMLEVSDLVKNNTIKLLQLQMDLTLPFAVKSIYMDNQQYYRYQVKSNIKYWLSQQTQVFLFDTNQKKNIKLAVFSAKQYLLTHKKTNIYISSYISSVFKSEAYAQKQIQNLWVPMSRFPNKYEQRQDIYTPTFRVDDLRSIKKQVLVGDEFEWFCSMQMQNGIKYDKTKSDLILEKPLGIAVLSGPQKALIYARVIF